VASDDITVRDNPAELRYEVVVGDELAALIRYRREPGIVVLVHTETEPAHRGKGVGALLAAGALDDIRARGLHVVPHCPFMIDYIADHPEYADLVVADPATPD
jgi:predicted GNAT family acetyltransferase